MAKRKKKEDAEEDDLPFKLPEFDRRGFILKEISQAKILFAISGLSIIFGILAFIFTKELNNAIIGLLVGIAGFFPIKRTAEWAADTSMLEKKDWLGHYAIYFLTFLAIWVLLFNYPMTDVAHPEIGDVGVYMMHYNTTSNRTEWVPAENSTVPAGSNISIRAKITDNGRLASVNIVIKDSSGNEKIRTTMLRNESTDTFHLDLNTTSTISTTNGSTTIGPGTYSFTITATDGAGNSFSTDPQQLIIRA